MLGLAIGAVIEAPGVDGDDLNQRITADLGEVQRSPALFSAILSSAPQQSHCVPCQGRKT